MLAHLDAKALAASDPAEMSALRRAATETGFATLENTSLDTTRVSEVLALYRAFFARPRAEKARIDMALTGSNRGWGGPGSEQVDPASNPDYKEVFDCGYELPLKDPRAGLSVYAPNLWPDGMPGFRTGIMQYYSDACAVAMDVLRALAEALGSPRDSFDTAFDAPMALLRGNYYPARPAQATELDFGIAPHTDYGCLTLLATDGAPGLEVQMGDGRWQGVIAPPGTFVINFGEMMEVWTNGRVRATPHRVVGGADERISVPLFFNPSYDADISPPGSEESRSAGTYLTRRFNETYLHLTKT